MQPYDKLDRTMSGYDPSRDGAAPRHRLASPPYEDRTPSDGGLPLYASRPDLFRGGNSPAPNDSDESSPASSSAGVTNNAARDPAEKLAEYDGYPTEKKLREHQYSASQQQHPQPQTNTLPRIAVTDPLHEMRTQGLEKPTRGLGEKSDYPGPKYAGARPGMQRQDSAASIRTESDYGYDDFDWSDDEGVEDQLKTQRQEEKAAYKRRNRKLSPWSITRWLFGSFLGNFCLSAMLAVPAIVMQFEYRNKATDANRDRRNYVTDNVQSWTIWAAFNLFMMWVLHILVELFPRVVLALVALVWGRTNQSVLSAAEYYNAQKAYIKPVFYAACSWGSFAIIFTSIYHLYNHSDPHASRAPYLRRLYQVVQFFFFVTLTICAEKIIIKNIALSFHKSAFAERLTDIAKSLDVFDRLKDYRPKWKEASRSPLAGFRAGLPRGMASHGATPTHEYPADDESGSGTHSPVQGRKASGGGGFFSRSKHHEKRAQQADPDLTGGTDSPAYPPNQAGKAHARLPNIKGKATGAGKSAARTFKSTASSASKIARLAMNDPLAVLQSESAGSFATINSPAEAKKLAKTIFTSFRGRARRSYLVLSDFEPAFPSRAEAQSAFAVFDRDGNGDISQTEVKNTVLSIYKERRFLMKAIGDTNHAVAQLDLILFVLACVIIMFEAFAIFNVNVDKTLSTFYTLGIAFAFIFKESAQNIFDSIVFIFVTHPMDTGDRIVLGEAVMVVKKMSLLSSEFVLADGTDMFVSNSVLANMSIVNYRRSGYQWENFVIQVDFHTTLEQLDAVERDMCHWLQTEPERHFEPSTALVPLKIDYMRSIEISVGMTHRVTTWQDWGMRFVRKNAFGAALTYYLKKHNVRYVAPCQPIVYWPEQAKQQPPEYTEDAADPDVYEIDDFSPQQDDTHLGVGNQGGKRPNYMGFTPIDSDDVDTSGLRQRRNKVGTGVTKQGGDG
ncbi:unnamed protein product [Sympodiomycopsis kandeliae]